MLAKKRQADLVAKPPHKTGGAGVTAPGHKPQNLDRRFDKTQLREKMHGRAVHRDYAAHFFRWGFATRRIKRLESRILDIGCGQDMPLMHVLLRDINAIPKSYLGVDLNHIPKKYDIRWVQAIMDEFNFVDQWPELDDFGPFDLITCFEVIEHMHVVDGVKLLKGARKLLAPGGNFILSTPVFNGKKMAANHLHEYYIGELEKAIGLAGLKVDRRWGTYGSWPDMKKVISAEELALVERLHEYYSHDVLSCFLAPLYPEASRNNVWELSSL